jgi:hypothetical protein
MKLRAISKVSNIGWSPPGQRCRLAHHRSGFGVFGDRELGSAPRQMQGSAMLQYQPLSSIDIFAGEHRTGAQVLRLNTQGSMR